MLDKAIAHGKEHRRQYRRSDSRGVDLSCRNHGSCPYCTGNRTYKNRKAEHMAAQQLEEYLGGYDEVLE